MSGTVLAPSSSRLHVVRTIHEPGPPSFEVVGIVGGLQRTLAERVRCGLTNAGFTFPAGCLYMTLEEADDTPPVGVDLAVALAAVLSEPAHEPMRRTGLMAWGEVRLDGTCAPCERKLISDLPNEPWVGRFWYPTDEVPSPEEDAVISIVPVCDLMEAWKALLGLNEVERSLEMQPN